MDKNDHQEGYCSSDDEVVWGPYTLREAKRDLRRPPLKINYRHTDLGLANVPVQSKSEKLEVSDSSAYFTPDESLAAQRNEAFLEKMEQVINEKEESRYASALDTTTHTMHTAAGSSGLSPILNNTNCYSINKLDSIQQLTLVDNTKEDMDTIVVSYSDEDDHSHALVISDTPDYSPRSDQKNLIEVEQPNEVINVSSTSCSEEEQLITFSSSSEQSVEEIKDEVSEKSDIMMMGLNDTIEEMEMMLRYGPNYTMPDEVDHALPQNGPLNTSTESSNLSYISDGPSDEVIQPVNTLEERLRSCRESNIMMLGLNDTIEEMEMMLKYGPNYVMPDEFDIKQNGSESPQHFDFHSRIRNKNFLAGKFDHVKSPVAEYIKKNTPIQSPKFKLPEPETRPTPKFPQNIQFKDIISPIKVYIKSPAVCLKKNVIGQVVPKLNLPDASVTSERDADATVSTDFPEVIYVPSKNVIMRTVKQQILPENIRKLVPTIEKHDKKTAKLKKEVITEKLLSDDLTSLSFSDPDLFENSKELDISYVTRKYVVPE